MKFKLFFFFTLIFNVSFYCQNEKITNYSVEMVGQFSKGVSAITWLPGEYEDKSVRGMVYLNEIWEGKHQIRLNSGEGLSIGSLNYNLAKSTLESKISKDSVFQIDSKNIEYIKLNDKKYKFLDIDGKNVLANVLYGSPKVTLIKVVSVSIGKATVNPMTKQVTSEATFVRNEKYMIRKGNQPFKNFELKKKRFINFFDEKANKLTEFSKSKKINFNSEKDIFPIFEFYDSI